MKKILSLIIIITVVLVLSVGCGTIDDKDTPKSGGNNSDVTDSPDNQDTTDNNDELPSDTVTFEAEVIEAGERLLVTPKEDSNEFRSSDKISVGLLDTSIKGLKGEEISSEELEAGDWIKIYYNGMIAESYPAQIGASVIELVGHNLLIDGYLAIIDDIYQEDPGLNGDIEMIAFDTAEWDGLTAIEKETIFASMKEQYGFEIIEGNYESLSEEGLIDKENLYFPKGIIITLTNIKYDEEKMELSYGVSKWRSGLGAIGSDDATAQYDGAQWKITKKNMWIS